jgi:hypothetical protein
MPQRSSVRVSVGINGFIGECLPFLPDRDVFPFPTGARASVSHLKPRSLPSQLSPFTTRRSNLETRISGAACHNLNGAGDGNVASHGTLLMDRSIRSTSVGSTLRLVQSPDYFFGPEPKGLSHRPPGIAVNVHRCKRTPWPFLIIGQDWICS